MGRGKSIHLFLVDGDVDGIVKVHQPNWTGVVYKMPRTQLRNCADLDYINQSGVYMLLGKLDQTGEDVVYIGQAGVRKNGNGLLNRLVEHNKDASKFYWTEAVCLTVTNNSFGPTEISYLEHTFCARATVAGSYVVKNSVDPTVGNVTKEKESELLDFIDHAAVILRVLGYKLFEPKLRSVNTQITPQAVPPVQSLILTYKLRDLIAKCEVTPEGFTLLKGSRVSLSARTSCSANIKKNRAKYSSKLDAQGVLLENIVFSSSTTAGEFVTYGNTNGNVAWKNDQGVPWGILRRTGAVLNSKI